MGLVLRPCNVMPLHSKTLLLAVALKFVLFPCMAKPDRVDSLLNALALVQEDSLKVDLLLKVAMEMGFSDHKGSLEKVNQAYALAQKRGYPGMEYKAIQLMGQAYYDFGELDSAMFFFNKARTYYEKIEDASSLRMSYRSIAQVHQERRSFEEATEYFHLSAQLAQQLEDTIALGNTYNDLGSLKISQAWYRGEDNMDSSRAYTYFREAVPYFLKAKNIFQPVGYHRGVALANGNLAIIYQELNQLEESLKYSFEALDYFEEMDYQGYMAISYNQIAQTYLELGRHGKALQMAEQALAIAEEMDRKPDLRNAYGKLSYIYEAMGNYRDALHYQKAFFNIHDQMLGEQTQGRITELEQAYKAEQKEREIRLLNEQKAFERSRYIRQRLWLASTFAGLVLMIVLATLLSRSNRLRKKAHRILLAKNEELEAQKNEIQSQHDLIQEQHQQISRHNMELKELYKEQQILQTMVAHDLKSPLNKIRGLVSVLQDSGSLEEKERALLDRINSITEGGTRLIGELTFLSSLENGRFQPQYERFELSRFITDTLNDHRYYAALKGVEVIPQLTEHPVFIHMDKAVLTRILDNLLSNAIKFSHAGDRVWVRTWDGNGRFGMVVVDEGPGITEADQGKLFKRFQKLSNRPTGGESSSGLGLSIVKELVNRLGGEVKVFSRVGNGSSFGVTFPQEEPETVPK